MSPRRLAGTNADLLLLLGVTLLVLALPTSGPLAHLEGFLGLMLALLAPGYLLAVALFPAHKVGPRCGHNVNGGPVRLRAQRHRSR